MSIDLSAKFADAGMGNEAVAAKTALLIQAERQLLAIRTGPGEIRRYFVPGRIEILGKHTDYAGGRSLLCAAERGICMAVSPRSDANIRIVDFVGSRDAELSFASSVEPGSRWLGYVTAVMRRILQNFPGEMRGANIVFGSDLPRAAGMSSSSALVIAIFSALSGVNHLHTRTEYRENIRTPEDLAAYLACIENGQSFGSLAGDTGVGTHGGSEDHTAILCCASRTLSQYSFCPARRERDIEFNRDLVFAIGVSGIVADKTGAAKDAYNRASQAAAAILRIWREQSRRNDASLYAAITSSQNAAAQILEAVKASSLADFPLALLADRFTQFLQETMDIIPAAGDAFLESDWSTFGNLVDRSQSAAQTLLRNQIPETIELARSARQLGALAASAFGAGFGGSVWALVPAKDAQRFLSAWTSSYREQFPEAAESSQFFLTPPGPALLEL